MFKKKQTEEALDGTELLRESGADEDPSGGEDRPDLT